MPIGGGNNAWSPFPVDSGSLTSTMPTKDGLEYKMKVIDESSRLFVSLCFGKQEEVSCDLCMAIPKEKKNVESSSNLIKVTKIGY